MEEDLSYVTEAFYRSEKEDSKHHFGLGLHISNRICESHGGKLLAYNNKSGGATIIASFQLVVDKK